MSNYEAEESNEEAVEAISTKQDRKSVIWVCSKGFGAGQYKHEACGRANAIWTTFDPVIGGNRNRRWLGHCPCGKVTAINPEAGNILDVKLTRIGGENYAEAWNVAKKAREAARSALTREAGVVE